MVLRLRQGRHVGRGECVPYAHYGETVEGVAALLRQAPLDHRALPPGAARSALDAALLDLEAKRSGLPVWRRLGLLAPRPLATMLSLGIERPNVLAERALAAHARGFLRFKLKADASEVLARVEAVHAALPSTPLVVDANESWSGTALEKLLPQLAERGVELIEQPLPADADAALAQIPRSIAICADEGAFTADDIAALAGKYDAVNVKLGKAGGLRAALSMIRVARRAGLRVMVGCMVCTSLGVAPALLAAQEAEFVDLDGPLLLARDRLHGLGPGPWLSPGPRSFWG